MKKLSLQWRLTRSQLFYCDHLRMPYHVCLRKWSILHGFSQEAVDAQNTDGDDSHQNEIYISIPDDKWDDFANDFSVQVYNNKADYKKRKACFFPSFWRFLEELPLIISVAGL